MNGFGTLASVAAPLLSQALKSNDPAQTLAGREIDYQLQDALVKFNDPHFWQPSGPDWKLLLAVALTAYVGGYMLSN